MRTIWLVRHGKPELPNGAVPSSENTVLSTLGHLQTRLTGLALGTPETVWCSRLLRCRMSAQQIGHQAVVADGLEELGPEEDAENGLTRFQAALNGLLASTTGELVIVTHLDIIQLLLCRLTNQPFAQADKIFVPYAGAVQLRLGGGSLLEPVSWGESPHPKLARQECLALLDALDTPSNISTHCQAVAEAADRLCREVKAVGKFPDEDVVMAAALLHDIARREPNHDILGATWLEELGYPKIASCIRTHHDLLSGSLEAMIVNLADKLVIENRAVTLEERFAASAAKCDTPEAKAAHERRYEEARHLHARILG